MVKKASRKVVSKKPKSKAPKSKKETPKGKILRKAYTKKDGTKVPAGYVKDQGSPGKTPAYKRTLPKLRKGELSKYGYQDVKSMPKEERHESLDKAVKEYGPMGVYRKLNAVRSYVKNTSPKTYKKMGYDAKYVKKSYGIGKEDAPYKQGSYKKYSEKKSYGYSKKY